jgi:hypothetical protein
MTEAFKTALPAPRKLVLLALCDNSNDQGECYPSVSMLCTKCSMSERGVQTAIAQLEADGYLKRDFRTGRSTLYQIAHPRTWRTPAPDAPPHEMRPAPALDAPPPPQVVHPTPAPCAPITINEPSIEPSENPKAKAKFSALDFLIVAGVPEGVAEDWLALRKKKNLPPTHTALEGLLKKLREAGFTPEDGVRLCCERGWAGFDKSWLPEAKRQPVPAYQTPNEKAKAWADRLTGKTRHATDNHIIDITPANPLGLD